MAPYFCSLPSEKREDEAATKLLQNGLNTPIRVQAREKESDFNPYLLLAPYGTLKHWLGKWGDEFLYCTTTGRAPQAPDFVFQLCQSVRVLMLCQDADDMARNFGLDRRTAAEQKDNLRTWHMCQRMADVLCKMFGKQRVIEAFGEQVIEHLPQTTGIEDLRERLHAGEKKTAAIRPKRVLKATKKSEETVTSDPFDALGI